MLFNRREGLTIYVYQASIDMRCGFHKLTAFVREAYSMQTLLDGHVFVFFGKNRFRLKILLFDGSGLILVTKRLEKGRFMWVQDLEQKTVTLTELEQLLHGSALRRGHLGEIPRRKEIA